MCTELTDNIDCGKVRGWVLYDAECALCLDLLARARSTLEAGGFRADPLQSAWVRERLKLPEETLLAEMRVLTRTGQVICGADALVYLCASLDPRRRPWWAWVLAIAGSLPLGMPLLRRAYAWVAAHRHCRQGACSLDRT